MFSEPTLHLDYADPNRDAATSLRDLAALAGNRFEALVGDRKGQYSIRVNDQWRICFEWPDRTAGPSNVATDLALLRRPVTYSRQTVHWPGSFRDGKSQQSQREGLPHRGASLPKRCSMDRAWLIRKILTGLVILGAVIFGIVRLGAGTAAVAGLGNLPMSMVPAGLRRFLFGERNSTAHIAQK